LASYLVTGGCGFIGSHLADALIAAGHRVRILDDLSTGVRENAPGDAEIIIGDVGDASVVASAVAGMEGCFHLAAIASVQRSNEDWRGTHRVNLTGAINVFDYARNAANGAPIPVVYVSSAAIYGNNEAVPLAETELPAPLTAYGADKLGCEHHARVAHHVHGVPTTGFRFFNIYGPRQDPASPYSGVISIFTDRILAGKSIALHGGGEQTRDFVYVRDAVRFLMRAMEGRAGAAEVFNVCTGRATSVKRLAEIIAEVAGKESQTSIEPARQGDIFASVGNPEAARRMLGIDAETPVEEGLRLTVRALSGN
jgi:UDP-glucose 4-epimerase